MRSDGGGWGSVGGEWKWTNVPIPEPYLAVLAAGIGLHRFLPLRLPVRPRVGRTVGLTLLLGGALLGAWAVSAAGKTEMSEPDRLIASGPYAITRNPMYFAWALFTAGIALIANAGWMLLLLPAAVAYIHSREIPREERYLQRKFDGAYVYYQAIVPTWL